MTSGIFKKNIIDLSTVMMVQCTLLEGMISNKVMILKASVHFCLNHK